MDDLGIGRSWSLSTDYIILTYLRSSVMSRNIAELRCKEGEFDAFPTKPQQMVGVRLI